MKLIECKAKSPRHGLDVKQQEMPKYGMIFLIILLAQSARIFSISNAKYSLYWAYHWINVILFFPPTREVRYGVALPLVENILIYQILLPISHQVNFLLSEQKLVFLLRALLLRPLTLDPACVPRAFYSQRLMHRQQATKNTLQKEWVPHF